MRLSWALGTPASCSHSRIAALDAHSSLPTANSTCTHAHHSLAKAQNAADMRANAGHASERLGTGVQIGQDRASRTQTRTRDKGSCGVAKCTAVRVDKIL